MILSDHKSWDANGPSFLEDLRNYRYAPTVWPIDQICREKERVLGGGVRLVLRGGGPASPNFVTLILTPKRYNLERPN